MHHLVSTFHLPSQPQSAFRQGNIISIWILSYPWSMAVLMMTCHQQLDQLLSQIPFLHTTLSLTQIPTSTISSKARPNCASRGAPSTKRCFGYGYGKPHAVQTDRWKSHLTSGEMGEVQPQSARRSNESLSFRPKFCPLDGEVKLWWTSSKVQGLLSSDCLYH